MSDAELEIHLLRGVADGYEVELRFDNPKSETEIPRVRGTTRLDPDKLRDHLEDHQAYGEALTQVLFADAELRSFLRQVAAATATDGFHLRVRLRIAVDLPELHTLRWELLREIKPSGEIGGVITHSERRFFSRFMAGADWRRVEIGPKKSLKALLAVAAPSDLEEHGLDAIDAAQQLHRVQSGLSGIETHVAGVEEPLTAALLIERLRTTRADILYLVCHGSLNRDRRPGLFLCDDDGRMTICLGDDLAQRLTDLAALPCLAVLASCESAGVEEGDHLAAQASLAPLLAEAGVGAVTAMQGQISMDTVETFMPIFFRELLADGRIDRALAVARGAVRDRDDSWMPALFMRLKRGRIWYEPGFSRSDGPKSGAEEFAKWRSLIKSVRQGKLVPILGGEMSAHLRGSGMEIAAKLSGDESFPLGEHHRTELSRVTQFLSVTQSREFVRREVVELNRRGLLKYIPDLGDDAETLSYLKLVDRALEIQSEGDPYRILADLPVPVYVNACRDPFLIKSLKKAERDPQPLLSSWRRTRDNHPRAPKFDDEPTVERPVVHQVFGVLGKADSLVLTRDDFLDHTIAAAQYQLIPTVVSGALTRNSLLFLGFRLDAWDFQVLFRLIMALDGTHRLHRYAHVGVQVDPMEYAEEEVEGLRDYLEQYFMRGSDAPAISIYWGKVSDFLSELRGHLEAISEDEWPVVAEEASVDWLF